ncbi:hypothetical protein A9R10_20710 [Aeromonas piscicola]|nr:hypothetical protein A9R10_20710 [Aeromonas piscicola]
MDTTLADKSELDFLKFCKFINIFLCQTSLYSGLRYDDSEPTDHFYRHELLKEVNSLLPDVKGEVMLYEEFEMNISSQLLSMKGICQFIDAISPVEERLRWTKLFCLQLVIIGFLNTYGYDFQHTNDEQIDEILGFIKLHDSGNSVLDNFVSILEKYKLNTNADIIKLIDKINSSR